MPTLVDPPVIPCAHLLSLRGGYSLAMPRNASSNTPAGCPPEEAPSGQTFVSSGKAVSASSSAASSSGDRSSSPASSASTSK